LKTVITAWSPPGEPILGGEGEPVFGGSTNELLDGDVELLEVFLGRGDKECGDEEVTFSTNCMALAARSLGWVSTLKLRAMIQYIHMYNV